MKTTYNVCRRSKALFPLSGKENQRKEGCWKNPFVKWNLGSMKSFRSSTWMKQLPNRWLFMNLKEFEFLRKASLELKLLEVYQDSKLHMEKLPKRFKINNIVFFLKFMHIRNHWEFCTQIHYSILSGIWIKQSCF